MPVLVPRLASIATQKAVSNRVELRSTINGISSLSRRSPVIGMQIRPRPCMAMKLIASGVTFSAARQRSPSFSRSSSSTRMTILPRAMSSIAPLTLWNDTRFLSISDLAVIIEQLLQAAFLGSIRFAGQAARVEEAGDVAGDHVCFEVHGVARAFFTEVRHLRG